MRNRAANSPRIDIKDIVAQLAARIDTLCAELFPRGRIDRRYCQVGSLAGEPGQSLVVYLAGARQGRWSDYATGEFGDALDLVAQVLFRGNKSGAVQWSLRWLGHDGASGTTPQRRAPSPAGDTERQAQPEKDRKAAHAIWLAGVADLTGTPVARYLAGRGIELGRLARPPGAIRFHPELWHRNTQRHWPAMVSAIADHEGRFLAVHRTWLEVRNDGSVRKAPMERNKMVWPAYHGGFIRLARGVSGNPLRQAMPGERVFIAEGIEDGLTAALADPAARVLAAVSLANLANLVLPPAITRVAILAQNDSKRQAQAQLARGIAALQKRGLAVYVCRPPAAVKDLNDLIRGAA